MPNYIGIDLGTTYCAVAKVNPAGQAEIVANREGEHITPSVVMFDSGQPLVGTMAKRSAALNPLNVVQFVKRQMGAGDWRFVTEEGQQFGAIDISAIILKRLKEDAELLLGSPVDGAVVTVPAYFNDGQRKATMDAGAIAGLNVLEVVNEPTAAAIAYGLGRSTGPAKDETIVVYDLGGGTFDVTFMRLRAGKLEVIATGGDRNLGGFDFDNAVMELLNEAFKAEHGVDLFDDPAAAQDLREKAEVAKRTLSSPNMQSTQVFLAGGGKTKRVALTLADFDRVTKDLVQKTANILELVREDSGLAWTDVDKLLLVGGSTRMKSIPAIVEKVAGKAPSIELHPDEVVALGAALKAEFLGAAAAGGRGSRGGLEPPEIIDVCSHSMGVVVKRGMGQANSIVLKKDTPIPCEVSDVFTTVQDNQTGLRLKITEGEAEDLADVTMAAEADIAIPPYPAGAEVRVTFKYDKNGTIRVTVFDLTGKRDLGEVQLKRGSGLSDAALADKKRQLKGIAVA